jgi:ATP diphosphatase
MRSSAATWQHLKDELGDLLFQVVFHAQMASESGQFDFEAVAGAISDKLIRRHPHVFGAGGPLERRRAESRRGRTSRQQERGADRADCGTGRGAARAAGAACAPSSSASGPRASGFDFEHASQCADKVARSWPKCAPAATSPTAAAAADRGDFRGGRRSVVRRRKPRAQAGCRCGGGAARRQREIRAALPRHGILAAQRGEVFADWISPRKRRLWQAVKRGE